jgi:tetratricopeptide (TPR) repeat protein
MKLELHDIHPDAIKKALDKAKQYRSLLQPEMAESICLDILNIDETNQKALVVYVLALTDQLHIIERQSQIKDITQAIDKLESEYQRHYYSGILNERRALALMSQPMSRSFAYEYFIEALKCFQQAESLCPENNDEAILHWNSCIRTLTKEKLEPRQDATLAEIDMES